MMEEYNFYLNERYASWGRIQKGSKPTGQRRAPIVWCDPLEARARNIHNIIKKRLSWLNPQPLWFVTVTMPDKPYFRNLTIETQAETTDLLAPLKRAYRENFPGGYLFWDLEYSFKRKVGVHVHFACHPGEQLSQEDVKGWFRDNWCRISDSYASNVVDVQIFNRNEGDSFHANYLTKRTKVYPRMKLIENFGTMETFGLIGVVHYKKPKKLILSKDHKEVMIALVIKHSQEKIQHMTSSWDFVGEDLRDMVDNELNQIEQVKCGYGLHYLDKELYGILSDALKELGVM